MCIHGFADLEAPSAVEPARECFPTSGTSLPLGNHVPQLLSQHSLPPNVTALIRDPLSKVWQTFKLWF